MARASGATLLHHAPLGIEAACHSGCLVLVKQLRERIVQTHCGGEAKDDNDKHAQQLCATTTQLSSR